MTPMCDSECLFSTVSLTTGYGKVTIIRDVSVTVAKGDIVALIGRNGVGKSTMMKAIMGLLKAKTGTISLGGQDITHMPTHNRARLGVGYIPQGRGVFPRLSVEDNLAMGRMVNSAETDKDLDWIYDLFPRLADRKKQKAGTMSGGEQTMLAIGRALVGKPHLLVLDEPSEGLQPSIVQQIGDAVCTINNSIGVTVFFVEQNVELINRIARRAYVMDHGCIVGELNSQEVRSRESVKEHLAV